MEPKSTYLPYSHITKIAKALRAAKALVEAQQQLADLNASVKDWNRMGRDGDLEIEIVDDYTGSCTWWTIKK